ncbi:hypothetical protein [uncultured Pseudoalteromonas sp.]|uniref:hypothetical protein n=1 Tax=Pseudoalteromonas sp. DY56-GL22 TaxID=2967126 RepID=UPI00260D4482|nr:hypothetical protein [uncultured Pseudoalteromonas sp.]
MKINAMLLVFCTFMAACSAEETSLHDLTEDFHAWLLKPNTELTHFNYKDGVFKAKKTITSGGEIHYKKTGNNCIAYAPHRYFDKHTLKIAKAVFAECQVLLTNSKHRNTLDQSNNKLDFGKYKVSSANAFILAYAKTVESFSIYQVHGFAKEKRKTLQGRNADIIVSNGSKKPSKATVKISECLNNQVGSNVMLFGRDVFELGGTKNILTDMAPVNSQFFHIELSRQMRERLITNSQLLKQFSQCLIS